MILYIPQVSAHFKEKNWQKQAVH